MKRFTLFIVMTVMAVLSFGQAPSKASWLTARQTVAGMQQKESVEPARQMFAKAGSAVKGTAVADGLRIGARRTAMEAKAKLRARLPRLSTPQRRSAAWKVDVDENGIISDEPEGTAKLYTRSGMCYYTEDGVNYVQSSQAGLLKVVTAADGKTVYIRELVSETAGRQTWVKGEYSADGKKIVVPLGQKVAWLVSIGAPMVMEMLNYDASAGTFVVDEAAENVTLTVDGTTLKLDDTNENRILGLIYGNDNSWALSGDFGSVYAEFSEEQVEKPADVATTEYLMKSYNYDGYDATTKIQIGSKGNDVYVKGMLSLCAPDAWVKGTKSGDKVTFANGQYAGIYEDFYPIYLMGGEVDPASGQIALKDFELTYDAATDSYTTDMWLFENAMKEDLGFLDCYSDISITPLPDIEFDYTMITEQPAGEKKVYERAGMSYYLFFGQLNYAEQAGFTIEIVYDADGKTVYMKNPVTQASSGVWVKGTKEGNKIRVPMFQCIDYSPEDDYGVITARLAIEQFPDGSATYVPDYDTKEMVFAVDEQSGTISLEGTDQGVAIYGLIFTNTYQWNGYGDYESVYSPISGEVTTVPEGLARESWVMQYYEEDMPRYMYVDVAVDGDKIYIANLPEFDDNIAVVGTVKDGKAVFESDQFLGIVEDMEAVAYFGGATYRIDKIDYPEFGISFDTWDYTYTPTLEFAYDKEAKTMVAGENACFIINGGRPSESIQYIFACCDPKLSAYSEKSVKPVSPVFVDYTDASTSYGYINLCLDIQPTDVEGGFIDPTNLAYQVFVKKGGEVTPYVFKAGIHQMLDEDMEVIPYNFTDNYDITMGGVSVFIYESGVEDVGVEVINTALGQEKRSDRVWFYGGTDGIGSVATGTKEVGSVTVRNLSGMVTDGLTRGVNIVTYRYTDGTTATKKVIRR